MNHFSHFAILAIALSTLVSACAVPHEAPSTLKSEEQIARQIVDCMIENDPDSRPAIMAIGGKAAMAEYVRQVATRPELVAERDRFCSPSYSHTPTPTYAPHARTLAQQLADTKVTPNPPRIAAVLTAPNRAPNATPPGVHLQTHAISPAKTAGPTEVTSSLTYRYDASHTINNRQVPKNQSNCSGGSSALTRWSKTVPTSGPDNLLIDADGNLVQLVQLDFAQTHPGRRYSQSDCPDDQHTATATFQTKGLTLQPNLVGYIAEWRDQNGNLIGSDQAHDGISLTLRPDQKPEDLYDSPAAFSIYDSYSPDHQIKPTKTTNIGPFALTYETDPTQWPAQYQRREIFASSRWHETGRQSPDLTNESIQIADAHGNRWTLSHIHVTEKLGHNKGYDQVEYHIALSNDSRAAADFTGYEVSITTQNGASSSAHWDPLENRLPLEFAQFRVTVHTDTPTPVILTIHDLHQP